MNKREFLKTSGLLGLSTLLPVPKIFAANGGSTPQSCVLIPSETAGPFPLDALKVPPNSAFFRQDVREGKAGAQLNLRMKVLGLENCAPMQNVQVDIWQCDKDGDYSGYADMGTDGQTWLRGYQMTDANGEVEFITIFPGWYPGRVCHIHFQVRVSTSYAAVSQLAFDEAAKDAAYIAHSSVYTKGPDPLAVEEDFAFTDGYQYQLATLTPNTTTGGYDSYLEVTVKGVGLGVGYEEMQNAKQFSLRQNFPNPYADVTTIPLTLKQEADITLELWDLNGKKLSSINRKGLGVGEHDILIEPKALGLPVGSYIYQLEVRNNDGIFHDSKMMTAR